MEQGYVVLKAGTNPNDGCREMNAKGWNVKQVVVWVEGETTRHAFLLERPLPRTR